MTDQARRVNVTVDRSMATPVVGAKVASVVISVPARTGLRGAPCPTPTNQDR
jgi:hypothetical protein